MTIYSVFSGNINGRDTVVINTSGYGLSVAVGVYSFPFSNNILTATGNVTLTVQ